MHGINLKKNKKEKKSKKIIRAMEVVCHKNHGNWRSMDQNSERDLLSCARSLDRLLKSYQYRVEWLRARGSGKNLEAVGASPEQKHVD